MSAKKLGLLPRLIIAIVAGILIGNLTRSIHLPLPVQILATFNGVFGNFLSFIIPLIILGFVIPGIADLGSDAGKLLAITAGIAYGSTLLAGTLAFVTDSIFFPFFLSSHADIFSHANPEDALLPGLFGIDMPPLMGVMTALILSFVLGIGIAVTRSETLKNAAREFQNIVTKVIEVIIIPLLPIRIYQQDPCRTGWTYPQGIHQSICNRYCAACYYHTYSVYHCLYGCKTESLYID